MEKQNRGTQFLAKSPNQLLIPRNDLAIRKTYQVEIPLNNTGRGSKNKFVLNEILNPKSNGSVIFTGAETFTVGLVARSENGLVVVDTVDAAKLAIVFAWGSNEDIYLIPYQALNTQNNYGLIKRLKNIKISLTNSYVMIMDDTVPITPGKAAIVNFYYRDDITEATNAR